MGTLAVIKACRLTVLSMVVIVSVSGLHNGRIQSLQACSAAIRESGTHVSSDEHSSARTIVASSYRNAQKPTTQLGYYSSASQTT